MRHDASPRKHQLSMRNWALIQVLDLSSISIHSMHAYYILIVILEEKLSDTVLTHIIILRGGVIIHFQIPTR